MVPPRPKKSLSPSRASDFMSCPLRYRLRTIDKLPEPPGLEASRGSLVHSVLEHLFDRPAAERTLDHAEQLLEPRWEAMTKEEPELPALLFGPEGNWAAHLAGGPLGPPEPRAVADFFVGARARLARYFDMEDPAGVEPAERELYVTADLGDGLILRGIIDRVDRAPDGRIRVVDYKTGKAPRDQFAQSAMFQMQCYGLALWRDSGTIPTVLVLMYLGNSERLWYEPDQQGLEATERKVRALWTAIERALERGQWRANKSKLCDYCHFKALCPQWGGTPPPLPDPDIADPAAPAETH